jgi:CheY-like chemotaxis protein
MPSEIKFSGESILLVEDNEINIMVAKKYLEKWNLSVITARDGNEAIAYCKKNKFSLIIMDFHMPNMDGITATKKIREFDLLTPIIGLSADVTSDLKTNFTDYQMNGFISKPFKSKELYNLIAGFLKQH